MPTPFKISQANLRALADSTVGPPVPDSLRQCIDESLPPDEPPAFYCGFASGLACAIYVLSALDEGKAVEASLLALEINAAQRYFAADGAANEAG